MISHTLKIGSRCIGQGHPTFVIAEMAWAHDGSPEKAEGIARAAAESGADALGIHITSVKDYMVRHYGNPEAVSEGKPTSDVYDYLEKINMKTEDWLRISKVSKGCGLALCVMPNDMESLTFSRSLEPDAYVLHASCFVEEDFVRALGAEGRPVILRIGGATLGEIEQTVGLLREAGAEDLLLLHGIQIYPTPLEETHLHLLPTLRRIFGYPVGLADHIDGGTDLAQIIPTLAIPLGAVAIEKHITWDREERGEDFESALDPPLFKRFVEYVRAAETALGSPSMPPLTDALQQYRQVVRKRVVAARDLDAGTVLKPTHLVCKRSDEGAFPDERPYLIGRQLRKAVAQDGAVSFDLLS